MGHQPAPPFWPFKYAPPGDDPEMSREKGSREAKSTQSSQSKKEPDKADSSKQSGKQDGKGSPDASGDSLALADQELFTNVGFQLLIAALLMVLFVKLRSRAPWVYYPNIETNRSHPAYESGRGTLSWLKALYTMDDVTLLNYVGLDGFMFLQTLMLLLKICLLLSVCMAPWLCLVYFFSGSGSGSRSRFFVSLSIQNTAGTGQTNPLISATLLLLLYVVTCGILYLIFVYYKRYISLRQVYLQSPAAMTSIMKLKQLSLAMDEQKVPGAIDIKTRTVVMSRLPPQISTDGQCLAYMRALDIGEVESATLIKDTHRLQGLLETKEAIVQDIEKEVNNSFHEAQAHFSQNREMARVSFGGGDGDEEADLLASAMAAGGERRFSVGEKLEIANWYFERIGEFMKSRQKQTHLQLHLAKLRSAEEQIAAERGRVAAESAEREETVNEAYVGGRDGQPGHGSGSVAVNVDERLFQQPDLRRDVSFLTLQQLWNYRSNRRLFSLDIPAQTKKAFVTFRDRKTASIVIHSKIGSNIFSCSGTEAPSPHDILWKNITTDDVFNYAVKILSYVIFCFVCVLFSFTVTELIRMLDIKESKSDLAFIRFMRRNETLLSVYSGLIPPLVNNLLLFLVTFLLSALFTMQGIFSYSSFQVQLMSFSSGFFVFNGFLIVFVVQVAISTFRDGQAAGSPMTAEKFLSEISMHIVQQSLFFFNTIVQKCLSGTAIIFIKPGPFLFNFLVSPFIRKSRRQEREIAFSPPIDFGSAIPNTLIVFPMVLSYVLIAPIILVPGLLFYLFNYIAYKNDLVFSTRNEYESGGAFWRVSLRVILFSVVVFQITTMAILLTSQRSYVFPVLCAPALLLDYLYLSGLGQMFEKSGAYYPIGLAEEKFLDDFCAHALSDRQGMLAGWTEPAVRPDEDVLSITEMSDGGAQKGAQAGEQQAGALYQDPALLPNNSEIILPRHFFTVASYIRERDRENLYRMA